MFRRVFVSITVHLGPSSRDEDDEDKLFCLSLLKDIKIK